MKLLALLICVFMLAQMVYPTEAHQHNHHHRSRRFLETVKRRRCGEKLLHAVHAACQDSCSPGSGVNLSEVCCANECDYKDIRKACCPVNA